VGALRWFSAFVLGLVAVRLVVASSSALLAAPVLRRENFRGRPVVTAAGILVVIVVLFVAAGRSAVSALGPGADVGLDEAQTLVLLAVVGFALLGLIDDLLGDGDARGFRGHVGAALRGRLTTGFVKLAGGGALAVVLVATPGFADGRRLVVDAVLIALAANLANLLDRAPGRVGKVGLVAYVPLALVAGGSDIGAAVAVVMGAFLGLLRDDLGERIMLGDTGANVLGAVLGLGVVLGCGATTRAVTLIVLLALNLLSEFVSFSRLIAATPPLRAFDRLGRLP
jgi:UDP-N-acetylmuramyl pentapeptide phosphotransferase/UDP-N-acetylglucosamine-1-phosphate transferase